MESYLSRQRRDHTTFHQHAQIAAALEGCLQTCQSLSAAMEANQPTWDEKSEVMKRHENRLIDWANRTGAANRSLDHALRKSSALREQVVEILETFDQKLQSVLEDVRMTAIPLLSPALVEENWLSYFDAQTRPSTSAQAPVSEESLKQKFESLPILLDRLERLESILDNPFPSDIYSKDVLEGNDTLDVEITSRMFAKASINLKRRLGHANWQRKCYLKSIKPEGRGSSPTRNQSFTAPPAPWTATLPFASEPQSPRRTNVTHSHAQLVQSDSHRAALSRLASVSETASNSGTAFSKPDSGYITNTAPSLNDPDEFLRPKVLTVPRPPVPLTKGETFICPYCALPISVKDQPSPGHGLSTDGDAGHNPRARIMEISTSADWAAHVFADLEAYMCTSEKCAHETKTFALRDDWVNHELYAHRIPKVWSCESCGQEWLGKDRFKNHLTTTHLLREDQSEEVAALCVKHTATVPSHLDCSLCGFHCSFESFSNHVASHLEQLALTAIEDDDQVQNEVPRSPQSPTVAVEYANKYTLLQDFIQEQSHFMFEQPTRKNSFPQASYAETSRVVMSSSPTTAAMKPPPRPPRPRMTSRGPSYSYMQRVRELKAEDALKSAATTPAAQWKSPLPTVSSPFVTMQGATTTLQPPRNKDFVGRINDMGTIHDMLKQEGHICILMGIGGLGKSALAVEYTWKFKTFYSYIFWVAAETVMVCADSYSQIALKVVPNVNESTEEERLVNMSREFLEHTKDRWLLVFDNVDPGFDIQRFLPANMDDTHGSILITTQRRDLDVTQVSTKHSYIDLAALNLEESRHLLLKSASGAQEYDDLRNHPEYKLAGEIAKRAERLPLALSLIAGYVIASECTLSDFVDIWNERQRSQRATQKNAQDDGADANSAMDTVWNIGLREVATDARQLLNLLAFFDSDTIQKDLLVGPHEDPALDMLHSSSPIRWKRMTKELAKRRLINVENREGQEILSIHRKLQAKILDELKKEDDESKRNRVFKQVFTLLRTRFPTASPIQVPEPQKWPICKQYLPHVLSIKRLWQGTAIEIPASVKLAELMSDAGIDLWERGLTTEGLELLKSAEAMLDEGDFEEELLRANIHVVISLLLQDQGINNLSECRDRIGAALQTRLEYRTNTDYPIYTKNDEILLYNAWSDYACVLLQYNNYQEAAPIFDSCIEKYRQWGPPEEIPYEYAKYYHHKGYCHMYEGNFDEAIAHCEQGLHWVERATGQSAATNRWRFDLACVLLQSGDKRRALALHKEVLSARLELHGKFGLLTVQSYYAVGAMHAWLGEYMEAESFLRQILDLDEARPGVCPEAALARTQFHLSQIILDQRKAESTVDDHDSQDTSLKDSLLLDEAVHLAQLARRALGKPHPLGLLNANLDQTSDQQVGLSVEFDPDATGIPKEHELALFDHLQPVFDGRFTGLHVLQYLQE